MQEALWEAVRAAPDDDGPRQVLADALLAAGDPLGEWVVLQTRQAALGLHFAPHAALQLRALWREHGDDWVRRFFAVGDAERVAFHRGLPATVRCTAGAWLAQPEPAVPLTTLELTDVAPSHLGALLERPSTRGLRALRLRAADGERWALDEAKALGHAALPRLQHLGLLHAWRSFPAAHQFCSSPLVGGLHSLELGHSLSTEPVRVLEALAAAAPQLRELSIDDDLPPALARFVAHCRTVLFPDSFVRPQLSEVLAPRVALYLPPHVTAMVSHGGPTVGRWESITPLGARNGCDASLVRERGTGLEALLLRTRSVTSDLHSPLSWLEPEMAMIDARDVTLGPIDTGVLPGSEWAVFALASGERLDRLVERDGRLHLSAAAHAAAWAPLARWTAERGLYRPMPLSCVYAGPRGLQVQPLCGELHDRRRGPARFTRRDFIELSPEAVRSRPLDEKNASWVLAVQLLLTHGVQPFPGRGATDYELLTQILNGPEVQLFGHGLPGALRGVLQAALRRDPAQRPSPRELADALAGFETPATRAELSRLPGPPDTEGRAREQAQGWLEGSSVHEPEPRT
ncbi:MAG: hypothetical protein IPJ65_40330 [Archangiaceae bacterium]|nr:hypothetical protein [Archangiaceae bacterium]